MLLPGRVAISQRPEVVELAVKNRLPVIYNTAEWAEAGGLITYGTSITDLDRRAATYVDKILKGAKPADLPWSSRKNSNSSSSEGGETDRPEIRPMCWRERTE